MRLSYFGWSRSFRRSGTDPLLLIGGDPAGEERRNDCWRAVLETGRRLTPNVKGAGSREVVETMKIRPLWP
jgi:hypothetical protein